MLHTTSVALALHSVESQESINSNRSLYRYFLKIRMLLKTSKASNCLHDWIADNHRIY